MHLCLYFNLTYVYLIIEVRVGGVGGNLFIVSDTNFTFRKGGSDRVVLTYLLNDT